MKGLVTTLSAFEAARESISISQPQPSFMDTYFVEVRLATVLKASKRLAALQRRPLLVSAGAPEQRLMCLSERWFMLELAINAPR